jgi:hypothetical protein
MRSIRGASGNVAVDRPLRLQQHGNRRGVLLLLMLCLLMLFATMGVTFVLLAGQYRKGSAAHPRLEQCAINYHNQLNDAAMQVFRGSNNPQSVLSIHSLLEDFYGNDSISYASARNVTVKSAVSPQVDGGTSQFVDLKLSATLKWPLWQYYTGGGNPAPLFNNAPPFAGIAPSGFFNGCVLTFTTGPAAGQSTRIVGYDCASDTSGNNNTIGTTPTLRVMAFGGSANLIAQSGGTNPPLGVRFLINGRPFNGSGFGFNIPSAANKAALVDATDKPAGAPGGHLYALLPNPVFFDATLNPSYSTPGGIGGADEDYDAADWNNMLLGLVLDPRDVGNTSGPQFPPYPSLHRPELVSFWQTAGGATPPSPRQYMLRPFGQTSSPLGGAAPDHPNFTGSNPNPSGFDPINGPWDVDNDGDGIADSVWVDLGLPTQTAADGTTFKPLLAIRVLDMDGRLNVNAHGNAAQTESTYAQKIAGYFASTPQVGLPLGSSTALHPGTTNNQNVQSPLLGSGYGPAEINLGPLFQQQSATVNAPLTWQNLYQALLAGSLNNSTLSSALANLPTFEGRYGEASYVRNLPYADATAANLTALAPQAGISNLSAIDYGNLSSSSPLGNPLALVKHWGLPIPGFPSIPTAYGSPPDLWGRGCAALDLAGTPMSPGMSGQFYTATGPYAVQATSAGPSADTNRWGAYDTLNNPYALNLSRKGVRGGRVSGATDNPFTPDELARLLRIYDLDASALPPRLAALLDPSSLVPAPTVGITGTPPKGIGFYLPSLRNQVTTDSYDLPCPSIQSATTNTAYPAHPSAVNMRVEYPIILGPVELLTNAMLQGSPTAVPAAQIPKQLALMMPPDLMNGQRLDINRLFGNGLDDDADGVVDEPDEYGLGEPAWISGTASAPWMGSTGASPFPSEASTPVKLAIDWNHDRRTDANDAIFVRQQTARYLYVLAMAMMDPRTLGLGGTPAHQSATMQYDAAANYAAPLTANPYQVQFALAQWAINCVDFRDRDSIMTPFEFDVNPFNGWDVDGDLTTVTDLDSTVKFPVTVGVTMQTVVWGCERPELLITETLAWHDRRTEDLAADGGTVAAATDVNKDFDQRLVPQSACFIELFNPWTTQYSTVNGAAVSPSLSSATSDQNNGPSSAEAPGELYFDQNLANFDPSNFNTLYQPYVKYPQQPNQPAGVVLNKVPAKLANGTISPVWRMIFVNGTAGNSGAAVSPDPRTLDPDDPVYMSRPVFTRDVDRIVYFVNPVANEFATTAPLINSPCVTYFPGSNQPLPASLKPGRYAVVGSANQLIGGQYVSKVGRALGATDTTTLTASTRQIALQPNVSSEVNQVSILNNGQAPAEPAAGLDAQPVIAIVLDSAADLATAQPISRSFGISDPIQGYTTPSTLAKFGASLPGALNGEGEMYFQPTLVDPLDSAAAKTGGTVTTPLYNDPQLMIDTTYANYRTVHLQRLANPQVPFNPPPSDPTFGSLYDPSSPVNVYLTIDSASVDVTAFNGAWNSAASAPATDPGASGSNQYRFCSTQRGDQYQGATLPPQLNQPNLLWAHEYSHVPANGVLATLATPDGASAVGVNPHVFNFVLHHSLGYLNQGYGAASLGTAYASAANASGYPVAAPTQVYAGAPTAPFPWLTWNNRPFGSPLELALVPKSRQSRLLLDYSAAPAGSPIFASSSGAVVTYPVSASSSASFAKLNPSGSTTSIFGHLLNFFDSGQPNPTNNVANYLPNNLFRLFEYVQVPSKFVGAETVLDPVRSATTTYPLSGDFNPVTTSAPYPAMPFMAGSSSFWTYVQPPFNSVSEYRDPGRVNINTVQDPNVWQGVLNGAAGPLLAPSASSSLPNLAATLATNLSAAGSVSPANALGNTAPLAGNGAAVPTSTPSYFTNPFRSFTGAALTSSIYGPSGTYANAINLFPAPLRDIDATLLRSFPVGATANNLALFDAPSVPGLISGGTPSPYNDPTRSSYFRLQNASRMTNLLTTRSNVYAVWITVGYFQVCPWYGAGKTTSPVVYDTAHPDGYQLGQEIGSDTGDICRHRSFYMFDRTIPVGFERGVDHNVQNAILLHQFIE